MKNKVYVVVFCCALIVSSFVSVVNSLWIVQRHADVEYFSVSETISTYAYVFVFMVLLASFLLSLFRFHPVLPKIGGVLAYMCCGVLGSVVVSALVMGGYSTYATSMVVEACSAAPQKVTAYYDQHGKYPSALPEGSCDHSSEYFSWCDVPTVETDEEEWGIVLSCALHPSAMKMVYGSADMGMVHYSTTRIVYKNSLGAWNWGEDFCCGMQRNQDLIIRPVETQVNF